MLVNLNKLYKLDGDSVAHGFKFNNFTFIRRSEHGRSFIMVSETLINDTRTLAGMHLLMKQ